MNPSIASYVALASRFALAAVFVSAGLSKLPGRSDFVMAVRRYDLVPPRWARPIALTIPRLEIVGGLLLGIGVLIRINAGLLCALLCVFSVAVAINLIRGRRIECGCFGVGTPREITWVTVSQNVGLAGLAAVVLWDGASALSIDDLVFASTSSNVDANSGVSVAIAATLLPIVVALAAAMRRVRLPDASSEGR